MIYQLFGVDFVFGIEFFQLCCLAALLGLISKYSIGIFKIAYFSNNINEVLVFTLLPLIGFVITSTISNNIALSLGMVGALSIVRFRTPIKNPLELVIYFYLITLGIVINVDANLAINFTFIFISIVFLAEVYRKINEKIQGNKTTYTNWNYFLRIELISEAIELDSSINLYHKSFQNNSYVYSLGFDSKDSAFDTVNVIDRSRIISYNIDREDE